MEVLYPHCAGLDVHKETVVACVRHMVDGTVKREVAPAGALRQFRFWGERSIMRRRARAGRYGVSPNRRH
jgi:hypothetical protein